MDPPYKSRSAERCSPGASAAWSEAPSSDFQVTPSNLKQCVNRQWGGFHHDLDGLDLSGHVLVASAVGNLGTMQHALPFIHDCTPYTLLDTSAHRHPVTIPSLQVTYPFGIRSHGRRSSSNNLEVRRTLPKLGPDALADRTVGGVEVAPAWTLPCVASVPARQLSVS